MAYNRNIPQPTDLISNSQPQILGNFQAIDSGTTGTGIGLARNHVTMTDATNGGLHSRVDYYQAVASPGIVGFVSSLYPKTVTNAELFYKNTSKDVPITNTLLNHVVGEGMLPGGLQIRAASTGMNADSQIIPFTTPFPTACLSVVVSVSNTGNKPATINVISFTAAQFTVFHIPILPAGTLPINFSYIAIGY